MTLSKRTIAVASVFTFLFIIGFVLMGYEMLGSRYLNPYFGGGITTWAGLISVVLLAMMVGYLTGGYLIDSRPNIDLLSVLCILAGLSIASMTYIAIPMLKFILDVLGDGMFGVLIAASAISFVPVALLSASSPFVVRLLLQDLKTGGQTAGWVYGVSTLGNVFGTLVTTFTFIPNFGTKTITLYFGITLVVLGAIIFLLRNRITLGLGGRPIQAVICTMALLLIWSPEPSQASEGSIKAYYPEGPLWHNGKLYYAEMSRHRITVLEGRKTRAFWSKKRCGPTSISPYRKDSFLILCHLSAQLVIINNQGKTIRTISHKGNKRFLQNPNDSHSDGNGGVFFSDAGLFQSGAPATGVVYHISPNGNLKRIVTKLYYANGIAFDNKRKILYVSEHLAGKVWAFNLNKDYSIKSKNLFLDIATIWKKKDLDYAETGPDGIEIFRDGSIAVAIYGKGAVVLTKNKQRTIFSVDTKFVTNIARHQNSIAITGAYTNRQYPYKGRVRLVSARVFQGN